MVPFVDLKAQYQSIKPEIDAAVMKTLEDCSFVLGPQVASFEERFAAYCDSEFGVGVNSGTNALFLGLLAAGIGEGDEVITVPHTFIASASAIHYTGAKVVFCDIDPVSYTMDPEALEAAITPHTKAVMPVHLYGQMADMDAIMAIAKKHGLIVIEDAAQSHGAEYRGRRAGSIGDLAGFSFYPGKNLGAAGEAGITVTDNEIWNRKLRMLRDWGAEQKYHHEIIGYNMRMEGMQGRRPERENEPSRSLDGRASRCCGAIQRPVRRLWRSDPGRAGKPAACLSRLCHPHAREAALD